jgi:hypothetical protein
MSGNLVISLKSEQILRVLFNSGGSMIVK